MSIQHTVVFRLIHDSGSPQESEFLDTGRKQLSSIPGVTDFAIHEQISPKSNFQWQFTMIFTDREAYDAYNIHPVHVSFVENRWNTEVADFQEYDFMSHSA